MGGMQVGGRGNAPMMTTVGGQQGQGQATQQAPGMTEAAKGTQAAEGAELSGGGGAAEGGKGKGKNKGKGTGRGGEGFQLPPGLAGRSYEQLPPGIRKKMGAPQAQQGAPAACGMHGGSDKPAQAGGTSAPAQVAGTSAPAQQPAKAERPKDDAKMEQYLSDLAAGKVTKDAEPSGFKNWAQQQMLQGTDSTAPSATTAAPATATQAAAPAVPVGSATQSGSVTPAQG